MQRRLGPFAMACAAACLALTARDAAAATIATTPKPTPAHSSATSVASNPAAPPVAVAPHAAVAADLVGRWKLDIERSDYGKPDRPKPRETVTTIEQQGAHLMVHSVVVRSNGDTLRIAWDYPTDGHEAANTMMGQQVKTVGRWEDGALHVQSSATFMMNTFKTVERWSLSTDRARLTIERETQSPMGNQKQTMLYGRL